MRVFLSSLGLAALCAQGVFAQTAPQSGAVAPQDNAQQSTSGLQYQPQQQTNPQGPPAGYHPPGHDVARPIGSSMTDGMVVDYATLVARFKSARSAGELNDDQRLIRYLPSDQQADAARELAAQRVRVQRETGGK